MISGVASGILIESVLIWATVNPLFWTSSFKSIINNAPRLATILSLFLTSLNGLSKFADVKPYTELIAVFKALANCLDVNSPLITFCTYGVNFPSNILLTASQSSCLILTRPSTISLNRSVYSGPNKHSAITLCGCIEAISNRATFLCIPGSA